MFLLDGATIYIHRGDSASFDIVFREPDANQEQVNSTNQILARDLGIDFIPEDGTHVRFSVKVDVNKRRCIIQKDYVVNNGFVCIDLESIDTRGIPFGEYQWDIRFWFENGDTIDWNTPFNSYSFFVTEVVGNDVR